MNWWMALILVAYLFTMAFVVYLVCYTLLARRYYRYKDGKLYAKSGLLGHWVEANPEGVKN